MTFYDSMHVKRQILLQVVKQHLSIGGLHKHVNVSVQLTCLFKHLYSL